jgi:hypothetical protein
MHLGRCTPFSGGLGLLGGERVAPPLLQRPLRCSCRWLSSRLTLHSVCGASVPRRAHSPAPTPIHDPTMDASSRLTLHSVCGASVPRSDPDP